MTAAERLRTTTEHQKATRSESEILTPDEMTRLVRACSSRSSSGLRNRALIATVYRCGLRVSELIALDAGDVDRDARSIRVSSARRRTVCMDPGSFWLVEGWIERRREVGLEDAPPLFCTLRGARISPSYIRGLLPRLARKAGIDKRVSTEVIRRTLAVELAREGFPVGLIQAQLGHASPETTSRYLARAIPEEALEAFQQRSSWRP